MLGSFVWKRIYSYNIDDVVEHIYQSSETQRLALVSRREAFSDVDDPGDVQVVYLHGTVSRPSEGFVFSTRSYAEVVGEHSSWHYVFADELVSQPFIILGCGLNEFDLEVLLARRASLQKLRSRAAPSLFVTKEVDAVLRATCERHGFIPVEATTDTFLAELDGLAADRPSVLDLLRPKTVDHFLSSGSVAERVFFSQWRHVGDACEISQGYTGAPQLLTGVEPGWSHLCADEILPRADVANVVARAIGWSKNPNRSAVRMLYAPAGAGKTAMLLLIGQRLAATGVPTYFLHASPRLSIESTFGVLSAAKTPIVLICDSLADHIDQIGDLFERLSDTAARVMLIGAERATRQRLIEDLSEGLYPEASTMQPLSSDEGLAFVGALRRQGLLGARAGEPDQRLARKVMGSDLLPALLELTSNRTFADRMQSEVEELDDMERRVYGTICLAHQHGYSLKLAVLRAAVGAPMSRIVDIVSQRLGSLLQLRDGSEVLTRHRLVAEYAIRMFEHRYDYLVSLVQAIRPYVNRTTIKQRLSEARLAGRLLDADVVRGTVGARMPRFYEDIASGWEWNSRYWEQRALAILDDDPESALRYARQGAGIEHHPMPLTTLAQVQFAVASARQYEPFDDRRLVVEALQSVAEAIDLSRRYHRREIHAHDVGIRGALRFLDYAHGKVNLRDWEGWKLLAEIETDLQRVKAQGQAASLRQMVRAARGRFGRM